MHTFLAGLFAGFAITHFGFALFSDMSSLQFFGRTWSVARRLESVSAPVEF